MPRAMLCTLIIGLLVSSAIAKTWYVGGSGADFSEIQPAIDAAQDGDLILVRPGTPVGSSSQTPPRTWLRSDIVRSLCVPAAR